jgi:tetratricopeptide (TPR) repeat protein
MKKILFLFSFFTILVYTGYGQDARQKIEDINKEIVSEPENAALYRARGILYYELKQNHEALEDFNLAVSLNEDVDNLSARGLFYLRSRMFQEALKDFISITIIDPENADAYCSVSSAYLELLKYREAFYYVGKAIEMNPNDAGYYGNRAVLYYANGEFDKAIADCTHAIELAPYAIIYRGRGRMYQAIAGKTTNKKQKAEYEKKAKEDFAMVEKLGGVK